MFPSGAVATGTRKLFLKTGRLSYSLRTDAFSSGSRSVRTSAIPAADAAKQRVHLPCEKIRQGYEVHFAIPKNTARQRSTSTSVLASMCPKVAPTLLRFTVMILSTMI